MKKIMRLSGILFLIALILFGCKSSDEANAQKTAKEFGREIYTVDSKKIDKYNAIVKKLEDLTQTKQPNSQGIVSLPSNDETIISFDAAIKPLMTEGAYKELANNVKNTVYAGACLLGNFTMQVTDLTLSKNFYDKNEKNKAGYNFDVKLNIISNKGKTIQKDTASGYIGLVKENDKWKVFVYRENGFPKTVQEVITKSQK